jgi:hypothetical protein
MKRKFRILMLAALTAALVPCLQEGSIAFELFPRPEGQYTVQRGDSLFGIAGLYYANSALWPFLWNQNPHINIKGNVDKPELEPLTPGTKIDLYHSRLPFTAMSKEYAPATGIPLEARFLIAKTPLDGIPYDKKYFRFKLANRPTRLWGYIVSSPEVNKNNYLERDLVYIRFRPSKRQVVLVGDRFGIYRERGPLSHPVNPGTKIGHLAEVVGEVEIINTGHELATAIILDSYVEIVRGDRICLFTPRSRQIVPTKTHRMLTGTILRSGTRHDYYSDTQNLENDVVFIDRGSCDGMKEGLLFNIYRPSHPVADPYFIERRLSIPDRFLGEGMVLKAFEKNSTILITRSREEITPGDIVKSVSD